MSQIFGQNGKLYREISVYLSVSLLVGLDGGVGHVGHGVNRLHLPDCVQFTVSFLPFILPE